MSHVTQLASGQLTATDAVTIELIQADETPAVVIVPVAEAKPTVLHPHRFGAVADTAARTFAAAVVRLAQIRRERSL